MSTMRQYIPNSICSYEKVLSSVFPSTTSSAWASVITGEVPGYHGVYGTSYRINEHETYVWLNDSVSDKVNSYMKEGQQLFIGNQSTLFSSLGNKQKIYVGRHGQSENNSFFITLTSGIDKRIFPDLETYISMKYQPDELVDYIFDCINDELSADDEKLVWAYFDFDDFIHERGYEKLDYLWPLFFARLEQLVNKADSVILVADHGQTAQNQWEESVLGESENAVFSLRICGAGRVLYLYGDDTESLAKWAHEYYQDHALIMTRAEAINAGLFPKDCADEERIGDIIVIGKDFDFHSIGANYLYEHGACTEDEMFVPAVLFEKK